MPGRTIKIFLVNGDPAALRTVEIGLSTLKALISPRSALGELQARKDADRTGVYLLLGDDDTAPSRLALYVGEGDSVLDRIVKHDAAKDFWHTVALFVSKDENLTKAHARWLEARLVTMAKEAKRATVMNETSPVGGVLPEPDEAEMTEVISMIRLVLGTVGFDVFAPVAARDAPAGDAHVATKQAAEFKYEGEGFSATMRVEPAGYVVTMGSHARKAEAGSLQETYRRLRAGLKKTGVLVPKDENLEFATDYAFNSPSAAACAVSGTTMGGGAVWKLDDGTTYRDWEASRSSDT